MFLYPLLVELPEFLEEVDWNQVTSDPQTLYEIIMGSPLVFATDTVARVYLFDLNSYSTSDQACDIWCASQDGLEDESLLLGRSFYDFFLCFCLGESDSPKQKQRFIDPYLPEDTALLRVSTNYWIRSC
ncbi:MAG: hypothetical protein F6K00_26265 [Leptolyngbya sp. SIOISBB]|nr:hypothetical protein [Leptolyngbya sp. SIOISBB]